MLDKASVFLVTKDNDFYRGKDHERRLAYELAKDLEGRAHKLKIVYGLEELLSEIKIDMEVPTAALIDSLLRHRGDEIAQMLRHAHHSFTLEGDPAPTLRLFVTERPTRLFAEFTVEFPCTSTGSAGSTFGKLIVSGQGTYDTDTTSFVEVRNTELDLVEVSPGGAFSLLRSVRVL